MRYFRLATITAYFRNRQYGFAELDDGTAVFFHLNRNREVVINRDDEPDFGQDRRYAGRDGRPSWSIKIPAVGDRIICHILPPSRPGTKHTAPCWAYLDTWEDVKDRHYYPWKYIESAATVVS